MSKKSEQEHKEEIKQKIILHCKALVSKNDKIREKGFNYLVTLFFDSHQQIMENEDRDFLEDYHIILAIFLKLHQGLLEDEEFENLELLKKIKTKLEIQVAEEITDSDDLYEFQVTNEYYNEQLKKICNG